ncbi:Cdc37 N terminal kinase binding-domain-containing protein [Limtongia smithiae]|uniref:Cdc37 N terminal kinase binding-domain-containing protein n=1 Tax=Limtongia smithiae TaxID=1125753 RepID=UPI0034CDAE26
MVIDYSKWDKLELSDDSDVEVHPNVDKKSFIRWKQRDIHEKREERRHEIAVLKAESEMNAVLIARLTKIITGLEHIRDNPPSKDPSYVRDRLISEALVFEKNEIVRPVLRNAGSDGSNVPEEEEEGHSYVEMLESLIRLVKAEVEQLPDNEQDEGLIVGFAKHRDKLAQLQKECLERITSLQNEEAKHITSEDLHIGFDSTQVSKATKLDETSKAAKHKKKDKVETIEVLNAPSATAVTPMAAPPKDTEEDFRISPLAEQFANIDLGKYDMCLKFIGKHSEVVSEEEADGILFEAFELEMTGKFALAKQYVHNALLLQYCARLGRDGVTVFFGKIMTSSHPALGAFMQDVEQTYRHVKERSLVLLEERAKAAEGEEEVYEEMVELDKLTDEELAGLGLTREQALKMMQDAGSDADADAEDEGEDEEAENAEEEPVASTEETK